MSSGGKDGSTFMIDKTGDLKQFIRRCGESVSALHRHMPCQARHTSIVPSCSVLTGSIPSSSLMLCARGI